jgi:hypothetical protein
MDPKTPATRAVESLLISVAGGFMNQAAAADPPPPLAEEGESISPTSILRQMTKYIDADDHMSAARLALIFASWVARAQGLTWAEASKLAALSWAQTSGLPNPPKLRY